MSITVKYEPKRFTELVFADTYARNMCHRYAFNKPSKSLMLWGPAGSGKTTAARVIVNERFIRSGYEGHIEEFNGAELTSKDFLKLLNITNGMEFKSVEPILIINELDEMDRGEQAKLRAWMDRWKWVRIIATTNVNPYVQQVGSKLLDALRSRFECVQMKPPTLNDWLPRASNIFAAEGHPENEDDLRELLSEFSGDVRDMLPIIERTLDETNAATAVVPSPAIPTLRVVKGSDTP